MKIVCLLKFTPDVDSFEYDYTNHVLNRENSKMIINPDDACALGFALNLKKKHPDIEIEVVTMAPLSVKSMMEDVIRRRVNRGTILSDSAFGGSDTLTTSRIIAAYLKQTEYDVILTGTQTLDGDTAHVPSQLAEFLGIGQLSAITKIDEESFINGMPEVEADTENYVDVYRIPFPAVLSVRKESKYRLPFVRYADLEMDVSDRLQIVDHKMLGIDPLSAGLKGSATKVVKTYMQTYEQKDKVIVHNDKDGIETVYRFLKDNGYLK